MKTIPWFVCTVLALLLLAFEAEAGTAPHPVLCTTVKTKVRNGYKVEVIHCNNGEVDYRFTAPNGTSATFTSCFEDELVEYIDPPRNSSNPYFQIETNADDSGGLCGDGYEYTVVYVPQADRWEDDSCERYCQE